jgi:hypothetical protein
MLRRQKLLMLIPVVLLVPILLAMTPLNMAYKTANGMSFAPGKQCKYCNDHCPFHSIVSHGDLTVGISSSQPSYEDSVHPQEVCIMVPDSIHSNIYFNSIPLRC